METLLPLFSTMAQVGGGCALGSFDPCSGITNITAWVVRLATVAAGLFLIIDLLRHMAQSPKDWLQIGKDVIGIVVLLVVLARAPQIVQAGINWFS